MRRAALLHPDSLAGGELKVALERRRQTWGDLRLLSARPEDSGTLTEVAGEATLVETFDPDALTTVDALFVCGEPWPDEALIAELAERLLVVLMAPPDPPAIDQPLVAGLNLERAERGRPVVSPPAGSILLAYLLAPLRGLGLESATATVLEPASDRGRAGLDELLEQTRAMLAFRGEVPHEVFGDQLAFNLLPSPAPTEPLERALSRILASDARLSLQLVQAATFHGVAASLHAVCSPESSAAEVRQALAETSFVDAAADESATPVHAANRDGVLLGEVRADAGQPGAFWLWGAMDNLTRGGALNAIAIAEALLGTEGPPS